MSWDRIAGNRKKLKGSIRQRGGKLSDEQLELIAGRHGQPPETLEAMVDIVNDDAAGFSTEFSGQDADLH